jgi:O-acetylserine/cysteine efflux transporter
MVLATLTSVVWGFAFVATKLGIDGFSAPQLTALRFLIACLPVFFVARPRLPWPTLILIGLTLFTGQFLLLFFAFAHGMPPGLAAVTQQMQVFFTVLLSALFLRDVPSARQCAGMAVAFVGLALIASTKGRDLSFVALGLALSGALSWAIGNVLVKRARNTPIFPLVVWASLVPPLPALALSTAFRDQHGNLYEAVGSASWSAVGAVIYLAVFATVFAYAAWGSLLQRYPAVVVAPFALLAPCTGVASSALIFGEAFSPIRYAGMGLIFLGLAVIVLPAGVARVLRPLRGLRS